MANYEELKDRMEHGDVIILDGAVGTELQAMGVPMDPVSWCGPGNYTHTATVRQMHERYIRAGADIITTNTFNTLRPALEASGYGETVRETNTRAVDAALEAIDRAAGDRSVYIAGSISCRIPVRDRRTRVTLGRHRLRLRRQHLDGGAKSLRRRAGGDPGRVRRGLFPDREHVGRQRVQGGCN